jgi:hypothetical protein
MRPATRRTAAGLASLLAMAAFASTAQSGPVRASKGVASPRGRTVAAVAIRHCGLNGCTESNTLGIAAGGLGVSMTDDIPANATEASVSMAPKCGTAADRRVARVAACEQSFADMIDTFIGGVPKLTGLHSGTKAKRLVACIYLAGLARLAVLGDRTFDVVERAATAFDLILVMCVQALYADSALARDLPSADSARTSACGRIVKTLKLQFTKTGGEIAAKAVSATRTSKSRLPVSISCKHSGAGLLFTLKPSRRGQTLPQVIGPTVGIGYVNRGTAHTTVQTTFKVN